MSKIIEKNIAEIIVITLLIIVLSSCSSTYSYKSQEVVNTAEDMIEWIEWDIENDYLDSTRGDTYVSNLEQIIKELDDERL